MASQPTTAERARVSFDESLISKLPAGRFTIPGPGVGHDGASEEPGSASSPDIPRSNASTGRATPTGQPGGEQGDPMLASLHVKFSASTRFNATDATSSAELPGGMRATGPPRSNPLWEQNNGMFPRQTSSGLARRGTGRRSLGGAAPRSRMAGPPSSEPGGGPLGGFMRALSGRHRRSNSADTTPLRRSSSGGGALGRASGSLRRSLPALPSPGGSASARASRDGSAAVNAYDQQQANPSAGGVWGQRGSLRRSRTSSLGDAGTSGGGRRRGRSNSRDSGVLRGLLGSPPARASGSMRRSRSLSGGGESLLRSWLFGGSERGDGSNAAGAGTDRDTGRPQRGRRSARGRERGRSWSRSRSRREGSGGGRDTPLPEDGGNTSHDRRSAGRAQGGVGLSPSRSRSRSRGGAPGSEGQGASPQGERNPFLRFFASAGKRRSQSMRQSAEPEDPRSSVHRHSRSLSASPATDRGLQHERPVIEAAFDMPTRPSISPGRQSGASPARPPDSQGRGGLSPTMESQADTGDGLPSAFELRSSLAFRVEAQAGGSGEAAEQSTPTPRLPPPRPPIGRLELQRPAQLQPPRRQPLPFVPRISLASGQSGSVNGLHQNSFAGTSSLPSPAPTMSPTFGAALARVAQYQAQQTGRDASPPKASPARGSPIQGSPSRGSPQRSRPTSPTRRQQSANRPPRSASRVRRSASAPRSRAAQRRAEAMAAEGASGRARWRSRSARRHGEGDPGERKSFAALRRQRKLDATSAGGAGSPEPPGASGRLSNLFSWLLGRRKPPGASPSSSPERSNAARVVATASRPPSDLSVPRQEIQAASGTLGTASATTGSAPASGQDADTSGHPASRSSPISTSKGAHDPSAGSSSGRGVTIRQPSGPEASPVRSPRGAISPDPAPSAPAGLSRRPSAAPPSEGGLSRKPSRVPSSRHGRAEQQEPQGGERPSAGRPAPSEVQLPAATARDSMLLLPKASPAAQGEEPLRRAAERYRPTPLQIPDDPRVGPSGASQPGTAAAGGVHGAAAPGPAANAGGAASPTPEKKQEGGWARLGRAFGAMVALRRLSPSKAAADAAPVNPSPPATAADQVRQNAHGLVVSSSQLPMPAFPIPRPGAADAAADSSARQLSSLPALPPGSARSLPPRRLEVSPSRLGRIGASEAGSHTDEGSVKQHEQQPKQAERPAGGDAGAGGAAAQARRSASLDTPFLRMAKQLQGMDQDAKPRGEPVRASRRSRHSRAKSDLQPRLEAAGETAATTGRRSARANRSASADPVLSARDKAEPPQLLRAPANVPRGRSVSPLGLGAATATSRPGGGGGASRPSVSVVPWLAAAPPGQVLTSPLRPTPPAAALAAAGPPGTAPWSVEGQGVLITADRLPRIASFLLPRTGGRPLSPPQQLARQQPGLRDSSGSFLARGAEAVTTDPMVFPVGMPVPFVHPRLQATLGSDQPLMGSVGLGSTGGRPGTVTSSLAFEGASTAWGQAQLRAETAPSTGRPTSSQQPVRADEPPLPYYDQALRAGDAQTVSDAQAPTRSLRTPLLLGLRQPGLGLMLSQAPEAVQAVLRAESAAQRVEGETDAGMPAPAAATARTSPDPLRGAAWLPAQLLARFAERQQEQVAVYGGPSRSPSPGGPRSRRALFVSVSGPLTAPGAGARVWGEDAQRVSSPATDPLRAGIVSPLAPAHSLSPQQLPPSAYRRHRPLGLSSKPAEAYPPLRRPDPPPLLDPATSYLPRAPTAQPGIASAHPTRRKAGQAGEARVLLTTGLGGAGGDDDDTSSLASSATANSLREMHPTLALELRRRELVDPLGLGTSGVSGVTVRTLQREVTAGPHVKLMKPKQLLRQVQPPGPTPAFTRRIPTDPEAVQDAGGESVSFGQENTMGLPGSDPASLSADEHDMRLPGDAPAATTDQDTADHQNQRPSAQSSGRTSRHSSRHPSEPHSRQASPVPSRKASRRPSRQPSREPSVPDAEQGHGNGAPQRMENQAKHVTFVRVEDTGVPGVRPLAPPPLPAANRSPPRLLRVPRAPAAHQPTRRHVQMGDGAEEPSGPRFLNVKLMRVLNPPAAGEAAAARPPDMQAPAGLPMRRLRVLERPESELPGIVPAGTAGRTEHLLGMLRRPEERARAGAGIGHRVGLFDPVTPGAAPPEEAPPPAVSAAAVQAVALTGVKATGTESQQGRSAADGATRSPTANPAIDIFVHSSTASLPGLAQQPSPPAPPVPPYPDGHPYLQQQQPPVVVAAAAPGALAGLSALSQLTALTALTGLGAGMGVPPQDDPSMWPDLMETTPETLRQTAENTAIRWRQQRTILAQPNTGALRNMDPALQLEPQQMLGPGPLGEAQYALRNTEAPSGSPPRGAMDGMQRTQGGGGSPSRPDSPGRWLLSKSVDGKVLAVGQAARDGDWQQRQFQPQDQQYQQYSPQHAGRPQEPMRGEADGLSWREQERQRRRSALGAADEGSYKRDAEDARKREERGRSPADKDRHRRRRGNRHRRRSRSDSSSTSSSSSRSITSESDTESTSSRSSGHARRTRRRNRRHPHGDKHRRNVNVEAEPGGAAAKPAAEVASRPPLPPPADTPSTAAHPPPPDQSAQTNAAPSSVAPGSLTPPVHTRTTACQTSEVPDAEPPEPGLSQPEPGDDFGMELAQKLMRQMVEDPRGPTGRMGRTESSAGVAKSRTSVGGEDGNPRKVPAAEQQPADGEKEEGDEPVSPPNRRRLLERPDAEPRDSNSPNAKMVDVLHGPDTEAKAHEILARQASLRARFLAAADKLRTAVAAGFPSAAAGAAASLPGGQIPAGTTSTEGLSSEPTLMQLQPDGTPMSDAQASNPAPADNAVAPTLSAEAPQPRPSLDASAAAPSSNASGAAGGAGGAIGPAPVANAPYTTHGAMAGPPPHQAINIYCTQLVLNPGAGPITLPGMPAYYPAPGPAAWAGVPTAVPVVPSSALPTHAASSGVGEQQGRAVYLQSPSRPTAPAVPVSPVGTAAWLPQGHEALQVPAASESFGSHVQQTGPHVGHTVMQEPGNASEAHEVASVSQHSAHNGAGRVSRNASSSGEAAQWPHSRPPSVTDGPTALAMQEEVVSVHSQPSYESYVSYEQQEGARPDSIAPAKPAPDSTAGAATHLHEASLPSADGSQQAPPEASGTVTGPADSAGTSGGGEAGDGGQSRPPADQKAQLAAELTQLIMEAFQQSGGIIAPADEAIATTAPATKDRTHADFSSGPDASEASGAAAASFAGQVVSQPRLPSTLPNAAVPRGQGPRFLQIHDIELAAPAAGHTDFLEAAVDPATDAVTADILGGLGDWEAQVMSALQGRALQHPLPPATAITGPSSQPAAPQWQRAYTRAQHATGHGGAPAEGRDLTASEALAMEPSPGQQQALQRLRQRREQRAAAVAEKQARYRAGLQNFAEPSRQLRPLHVPPPQQHPSPADAAYEYEEEPGLPLPPQHVGTRPGGGSGGGVYLTRGALDGNNDSGPSTGAWGTQTGAASGGGGLWGVSRLARDLDDTHATLFPRRPQYQDGPGLERQPHPRSPLQRRMHGAARPRKRWSRPQMTPKAASLSLHQRDFTAQVRSALRVPGRPVSATSPARVTFADGTLRGSGDAMAGGMGAVPPGLAARDAGGGGGGRVPYMARASPATAAVRSLAAMVAKRVEEGTGARRNLESLYGGSTQGRIPSGAAVWAGSDDEDGDWDPDADELGPGNECGGCDYVGCPVHGSGAREERERMERAQTAAGSSQPPASQRHTSGVGKHGASNSTAAVAVGSEEALAARRQREQQRAQLLDRWMAEMRQLSAATARAEATKQVAVASAQQALSARRERQTAELAGIFNLLGEVDELATTMEQHTQDTKLMMRALEEEAELRKASRLNALLFEAQRLGGQVDDALDADSNPGDRNRIHADTATS